MGGHSATIPCKAAASILGLHDAAKTAGVLSGISFLLLFIEIQINIEATVS